MNGAPQGFVLGPALSRSVPEVGMEWRAHGADLQRAPSRDSRHFGCRVQVQNYFGQQENQSKVGQLDSAGTGANAAICVWEQVAGWQGCRQGLGAGGQQLNRSWAEGGVVAKGQEQQQAQVVGSGSFTLFSKASSGGCLVFGTDKDKLERAGRRGLGNRPGKAGRTGVI